MRDEAQSRSAGDAKLSRQKSAAQQKDSFLEWMRSFCFTRFDDESHREWLQDAPEWIEALPFPAVFILVWNLLAASPLWAMYLTMCITAMSVVTMVLQIVAMGIVQNNPFDTAGYWIFYFGSFGSPLFEVAWLLTQFLIGLAAEHVVTKVRPAAAREEAALQASRAAASKAPAASASSRQAKQQVRNPLDASSLFPQLDLKRSNLSVSSQASDASSRGMSQRGSTRDVSSPRNATALVSTAVGASSVTLDGKQSTAFEDLLRHKDSITAAFSILLWFAWAVHISGLYVYSHACASITQESEGEGVLTAATAFNCLDLDQTGDLLSNSASRFAMVGQLLHALASCGMLVTLWAMPPQAPFTAHGILKWGVLGFAAVTFTQLAFAVAESSESTSSKSWGQTLAMFSIRIMSCVFAVLAVVPLPPLTYLFSESEEEEGDSKLKHMQLSAGRTPQDEFRRRVSDQAMARLQEKQMNSCMQCSRWSMAVGLLGYMFVFVVYALLPLTGGTFVMSWGRLGFFAGTGISVYEVLLPLIIVSPLMLTIVRTMFLALISIHELCHRVHSSRAVYAWLAEYCLGCCCEVLCFVSCCCYACCREERERVVRGRFNCPDVREAWRNSPFLECFGCFSTERKDDEQLPILSSAPSARSTASPEGHAQGKVTQRKSLSVQGGVDADQVSPSVAPSAGGGAAGSASPMFITEEEPTHVLKLLREGLSESDVLAGVTEKPQRGQIVRGRLQGLASKARGGGTAAGAGAGSAREEQEAMREAANGLSNLSVVDLLNDDQYHNLLKALLPEGAVVYKGAPTEHEQHPDRARPTLRRKASAKSSAKAPPTSSIVAADRSQISWLPYSVWGVAFSCMLITPLYRAMNGDEFFYYSSAKPDRDAQTFAQTRFTLMVLLLLCYCARGAYSLRQTLRLLHRIRRVVEAAVSLDIHALEWNFPYDMHGAAEWSARLLFASRFVGAQFTGPTAGFVSAWLLGSILSAATLAILVLAGADWPHALSAPEFYAFAGVLVLYVGTGLFMLWQLLQTDDIIFGSIRDVSVLSARGGVVNTYRGLMAEYASSTQLGPGAAQGGRSAVRHSSPTNRDPAREESLRAASFAQLLSITWQQRYPGIQILAIEGLEASRVTLSKASFRALIAGASVSGISAVGRLLYSRLTKQA